MGTERSQVRHLHPYFLFRSFWVEWLTEERPEVHANGAAAAGGRASQQDSKMGRWFVFQCLIHDSVFLWFIFLGEWIERSLSKICGCLEAYGYSVQNKIKPHDLRFHVVAAIIEHGCPWVFGTDRYELAHKLLNKYVSFLIYFSRLHSIIVVTPAGCYASVLFEGREKMSLWRNE